MIMAEETENQTEAPVDETKSSERVSVDNLRVLENIDVTLTVEVGQTEIKIRDLLRLNEGSVIELDRLAGDPLDILVNGTIIARGEVVMVGERFGIRFSEIVSPEKRMENL
jgi:flagellar motor switch protein FliN/FliY